MSEDKDRIFSPVDELRGIRDELEILLNKVNTLLTTMGLNAVLIYTDIHGSPKELYYYPHDHGWNEKIHWAIFQLDEGSPQEVTDLLLTVERGIEAKSLLNIVSQYLPTMYSKGKFARRKEGRRYLYSIVKKELKK